MTLSPPAPREPLHHRRYSFDGYRRADGLWDIEGHLTDTKTYSFPNHWRGEVAAGEPVHDMWIRLTVDEELLIHDIEVVTAAAPFEICGDVAPRFAAVKGLRIGKGWRKALRDRLGGAAGCTHQVEMLAAMATAAFQTIFPARERAAEQAIAAGARPPLLDSCHALASDSPVVQRIWPDFYRGE